MMQAYTNAATIFLACVRELDKQGVEKVLAVTMDIDDGDDNDNDNTLSNVQLSPLQHYTSPPELDSSDVVPMDDSPGSSFTLTSESVDVSIGTDGVDNPDLTDSFSTVSRNSKMTPSLVLPV